MYENNLVSQQKWSQLSTKYYYLPPVWQNEILDEKRCKHGECYIISFIYSGTNSISGSGNEESITTPVLFPLRMWSPLTWFVASLRLIEDSQYWPMVCSDPNQSAFS